MAEEWGFVGSVVLVLLFLMLIIWGLNIAYGCRDTFGVTLAFGVTATIFWQILINIGMVMGLMPVVGIPLNANRCARWTGAFHPTSTSAEQVAKLLRSA